MYKIRRKQLTKDSIASFSISMLLQFKKLKLAGSRHILSYAPIAGQNEFDVRLCDPVIRMHAARISLPRINTNTFTMEAIEFGDSTELIRNRLDIQEPVGEPLDPHEIDAVLVPLLAFDRKGYRVGYGKGYYDRFLVRCRPDIIKIGFSFFEPVEAIDDISLFDVPLNYSITPMRLYEF